MKLADYLRQNRRFEWRSDELILRLEYRRRDLLAMFLDPTYDYLDFSWCPKGTAEDAAS